MKLLDHAAEMYGVLQATADLLKDAGAFPRMVVVDDAGDPRAKDGLHRIYRKELTGLIVRRVFSPERLQAVAERLADPNLERVRPHNEARELHVGHLLQWSGSERGAYYAAARRFERVTASLFEGGLSFEDGVDAALGALAGGRPVRVATPTGEPYSRATIRLMGRGTGLSPHFDNQQLPFPGYDELRRHIDVSTIMSFFVPIALPRAGGELVVYERWWCERDNDFSRRDLQEQLAADVRTSKCATLRPEVGDMIVFDAGRLLHQVTDVVGRAPRYTIGGFLAFSRDHKSLLTWA